MLRNAVRLLTLVFLLAPAAARAQETYEIKFKKGADAAKTLRESTEDTTLRMKLIDANQNALKEEDKKEKKHFVYRQTILERKKGEDRPSKLKREYRKASVTENNDTKTLALEGRTVLIEKKGDKYEFAIEGGGDLADADRKALDGEFNGKQNKSEEFEKLMLPGKAVKVGEEWKIDSRVMLKAMELDGKIDVDRQKITSVGKLVKAYKKDRAQYGVIEMTIELVPLSITEGGVKVEFKPGGKIKVAMTVDGCIDGSSETGQMRAVMVFDGTATVPLPDGTNLTMILTSGGTMNERVTEE